MGKSTLVSNTHSALAEHGQRLRMVEMRNRIHDAQILDLVIAMAQRGKDLIINPDTMDVEEVGTLDQKVRSDYMKILCHKLISNAQIPKEIKDTPSSAEQWQKALAQIEAEDQT